MFLSKDLEGKTLEKMMQIYCRDKHQLAVMDCKECSPLLSYARERLKRCPFGGQKPVCARCQVHCYKPEMREKIKKVMRHAGPKMMGISPLLTLRYIIRKLIK